MLETCANVRNLCIRCIFRSREINDEDFSVFGLLQDVVDQPDGADGVTATWRVVFERRLCATVRKTLPNLQSILLIIQSFWKSVILKLVHERDI